MSYQILAINPGSTSTKIAFFEDETEIWSRSISHSTEELLHYPTLFDQLVMRYEKIIDTITYHDIPLTSLSAVVGRGGMLPPVHSGAYLVNKAMLDQLEFDPVGEHASNLGAPLAYRVAEQLSIPAYIYDPVTVDEMIDVVRITGWKVINRFGKGHNLNMRAAALRYARENGLDYHEQNLIVAHLGGGITSSLHSKGRIIDMISDDEGAFSPERAGLLPGQQLLKVFSQCGLGEKELSRMMRRTGGMMDHLGTTDLREVEKRIASGDEHARLIYEAMALNVAKDIARLAAVVCGEVDAIILTGGIAYSKKFTALVTERVKWIAPVKIFAGENEMESLAHGALRVLTGEEEAHEYVARPVVTACPVDKE
ncbi:MAG: butyrate kinase [Oscillospiraceae bacterium]|nr:MAG: butyrate kinase [Oscillospiraceae bacterium]